MTWAVASAGMNILPLNGMIMDKKVYFWAEKTCLFQFLVNSKYQHFTSYFLMMQSKDLLEESSDAKTQEK